MTDDLTPAARTSDAPGWPHQAGAAGTASDGYRSPATHTPLPREVSDPAEPGARRRTDR